MTSKRRLQIANLLSDANAYFRMGLHEEAKKQYLAVIDLNNNNYDAYLGAGKCFFHLGFFELAKKYFISASKRKTEIEVAFYLSIINIELGEYEDGLKLLDEIINKNPKFAEALNNKAYVLKILNRIDEALEYSSSALRLEPDNNDFLINHANILEFQKDYIRALETIDIVLKNSPNEISALINKGNILNRLGRNKEAVQFLERALFLEKNLSLAKINLANVYNDLGEFSKASELYREILTHDNSNEAIIESLIQSELNAAQYTSAEEIIKKQLLKTPKSGALRFQLSQIQLGRREFLDGWANYEARWDEPIFISAERREIRDLAERISRFQKIDDLVDKKILIIEDQGIGDVIMFLSTLNELHEISSEVKVIFDKRLKRLFSNSFDRIEFNSWEDVDNIHIGDFDKIIRTSSLGYIFRKNEKKFSGIPFLNPSDAAVDKFSGIKANKKINIGISWRGGTIATGMAYRSLALHDLLPILTDQVFNFISIQYGAVEDEIFNFNREHNVDIRFFDKNSINDFDDLAGLVKNLDYVLSVQNTNVHLSGALGVNCIAMLPLSPEWRYGLSGDKMLWYNSVELIRQTKFMDWTSVIEAAKGRIISGTKKY